MLFQSLTEGKCGGKQLAFVRHMERVPSLDRVNEALGCMCLQWWATAGFVKEDLGVEEKAEDGDAMAAGERFGAVLF